MIPFKSLAVAALAAGLATGASGAIRAVTPDNYGGNTNAWQVKRHLQKVEIAKKGDVDVVFVGDSITHNMEPHFWNNYITNTWPRALNLGYCGDRTEHVLWRLGNGEMDGYRAKCVVLMIGTNNTGHDRGEQEPPIDTILGIREVLSLIRRKQPQAKIVLMPILPRGATAKDPLRLRNDTVNRVISRFADAKTIFWCDCSEQFLTPDGEMSYELFFDLLHPTGLGYQYLYGAVKPYVDAALSDGRLPMPGNRYGSHLRKDQCVTDKNMATLPRANGDQVSGWWIGRVHEHRNQIADSKGKFDLVFVGDSITHRWDGTSALRELRKTYTVLNLGYGFDATQNAIWRLENGELEGYKAKCFMVMIGTNNASKPEGTAAGVKRILELIAAKHPESKVLLLPIFPRGANAKDARRQVREKVNAIIKGYADGEKVIWVDFNAKLLDADGSTKPYMMSDLLHPVDETYEKVWLPAVLPYFQKICGENPKGAK